MGHPESEDDARSLPRRLGTCKTDLADDTLDMVLLDELTYMVAYDYLPLEEVLTALKNRTSSDGDYHRSRLPPGYS
ncbi:cob(I)yrinic acid a,c-diamide adenosyltransferase [Shigella flexneri]